MAKRVKQENGEKPLQMVVVVQDWAKDLIGILQKHKLDVRLGVDIRYFTADHDFANDPAFPDADVRVLGLAGPPKPLVDELLSRHCPNVQWVHAFSAGVDSLLTEQLKASNLPLTNSKGAFSESLAEWTAFAMLYFAKRHPQCLSQYESRVWHKYRPLMLKGKTLAIVGYGSIGEAIARVASAGFGMRVVAVKRNTQLDDRARQWVREVHSTDKVLEVLPRADYVVCALPGTEDTRHFFNAQTLGALKQDSVFISLGRGVAVDERALVKLLVEDRIVGAALDVFEVEPLPKDSPLWTVGREKLLLSPHCADFTHDYWDSAVEVLEENLRAFLSSQPLVTLVDKQRGY